VQELSNTFELIFYKRCRNSSQECFILGLAQSQKVGSAGILPLQISMAKCMHLAHFEIRTFRDEIFLR
jgi:hypothetical protein